MIDKNKFIVSNCILEILLKDMTTGKNIVWGTDQYGYKPDSNMEIEQVLKNDILPRIFKSYEDQKVRTKSKAEVFTPLYIVKRMNDTVDDEFQGSDYDYIKRIVLEITCGEAPFIVSRYDASTGDEIPLDDRQGMFDRKMRIVNKIGKETWFKNMLMSLESIYAYELQGDSLLLARINIYNDICEWYMDLYGVGMKDNIEVANHIVNNIIQMDGLDMMVPYTGIPARIMDWNNGEMVRFDDETDETSLF